MNSERVVGWSLLTIGMILIFFTLLFSYRIFTGKSLPPKFFKYETFNLPMEQIQKEINVKEELKMVLPSDFLSNVGNLIVWCLLAWILISGGGQISSLGIKLIKR